MRGRAESGSLRLGCLVQLAECIGYGGSSPDRRADIISLEYALRAMKEATGRAQDRADLENLPEPG